MTDHPVPSGESERLEERLREVLRYATSEYMGVRKCAVRREYLIEAADELARLRAEVARVTAEREDHGPNGRNVTNAQHLAMRERALAAEAEAARYREALEEIAHTARGDYTGPNIARRTILIAEGGDRAEE